MATVLDSVQLEKRRGNIFVVLGGAGVGEVGGLLLPFSYFKRYLKAPPRANKYNAVFLMLYLCMQ